MKPHYFTIILITLLGLGIPQQSLARPVVADLAIRAIEIDHNFNGVDILLFGAREDIGDIIVVARGPEQNYSVRKKERVMGIWANTSEALFNRAYGYYAVASSKPLDALKNDALLSALGIGINHLPFYSPTRGKESAESLGEFRQAFIRQKQAKGLYAGELERISFWGETLFRTVLKFPKNIMKGKYTVEVYLFNDGQLTAMQSTPIKVSKTGFEAYVYDIAHRRPLLYGMVAVVIALAAGWLASFIFHNRSL